MLIPQELQLSQDYMQESLNFGTLNYLEYKPLIR